MRALICGIYKIKCIINNRVYVGSSSDILNRWTDHRSRLRANNHANLRLQNSWNKHKEKNFILDIIEVCNEDKLVEREQYWIDTLDACGFGYNIVESVIRRFPDHQKEYIITRPNGKEEIIKNLNKFCKTNDLNSGAMSQVTLGNVNQHRGYKCRYIGQTKENWEKSKKRHWKSGGGWRGQWMVIHPNGKKEIIDSLTSFCESHNLSQGNMVEVANGKRSQHKNYKCEKFNSDQTNGNYEFRWCERSKGKHKSKFIGTWLITYPDLSQEETNNISQFCKNHNLISSCMYRVAKGKCKQHRGYQCQKLPSIRS